MQKSHHIVKQTLNHLVQKQSLPDDLMTQTMEIIMQGEATPAQIGAFLMGLRVKGESVTEMVCAAKVMRNFALKLELNAPYLIDTCGTGGDGKSIFNVSTACAFVAAVAGASVAKHGNRSVSGASGSADVLELLGLKLTLTPEQVKQCIIEHDVGFLFAPNHHQAMKHAVGPRKELGLRTLFNLLGPLTNPAQVKRQILGVFSKQWIRPLAEVLYKLGSQHVMVVNAQDGLDELSINTSTEVAELKNGKIIHYTVHPEQFGIALQPLDTLVINGAKNSAKLIKDALTGIPGPAFDMVALNSGAAIYVSGLVDDLASGIEQAKTIQTEGLAWHKLQKLVHYTQTL